MMKAIVDKGTSIAVFMCNDSDKIVLSENGLSGKIRAIDVTSITHDVIDIDDNRYFVGGKWKIENGEWVATDQEWLEAYTADVIAADQLEYAQKISAESSIAIQEMLDSKCREYEYDSMNNATGWAPFFDDAMALALWGKACWEKSKQLRGEFLAGSRQLPTVSEVIAEMPAFSPQTEA